MSALRTRSLTEALVAGFAFGTASIFIRFLSLYGVNSFSIAFFRLLIGVLILLVLIYGLLPNKVGVKTFDREILSDIRIIIVMALALSLHFIFYIQSVIDTYIINATLLVNTTPILTLIMSYFLGVARVSRLDVASVSLGFLGAFIMVVNGLGGGGTLIGDIEALIAALLYAVYIMAGKFLSIKDTLSVMSAVYVFSIPVIFIYAIIVDVPIQFPIDSFWAIVFLFSLGIIPTAIGHTLFISSLKGLKPHETSLIGLLEPVSATIYSIFLFGELPPVYSLVGGVIIAFSIYLISVRGAK